MPTKIEWAEETWSPVTGCTKVSAGCKNCYAERMARRLGGRYGYPQAPHHFDVTLHPDRLEQPLHWKKPRTIFVCSMGDLFHGDVPAEFLFRVWQTMFMARDHTYLILTKRPERMRAFIDALALHPGPHYQSRSNIWLGVSVENQETADERIPLLLQIPAAVWFVSLEPLLGEIDLGRYLGLLWEINDIGQGVWFKIPRREGYIYPSVTLGGVIVGGETGHGARPMHPDWVWGIREQCQEAGAAFFFKAWGSWLPVRPFAWDDEWSQGEMPLNLDGTDCRGHEALVDEACWLMRRVGKKRAGRLLDGKEHNEMPAAHVTTPRRL